MSRTFQKNCAAPDRPGSRWKGWVLAILGALPAATSAGPVLTTYQNQQAFVDLRYGMFIHFNMGTFTGEEWATPNLDPLTFAPDTVDCGQWAAAAKAGGMKFAVLTTKHHDGFCLWPTAYTKYNVMNSKYKHDIVKQYMDAFRAAGVTPCLYFSIWDRTQGIAKGSVTKADLDFIVGQLTELLSNYGDIPILMFDGWTWQMGHREVPYQLIRETVKKLQPNCLIIDHNGLTQPFEEDVLNFEHFTVPGTNTYASTQGNPIMPKWFWHPGYDTMDPLNLNSLLSRLGTTESHWCNFLLDCPPNRHGKLDANIVTRLAEAGAKWKPNVARAQLPVPAPVLEHPVTPVTAVASSGNTAMNAIDATNDFVSGVDIQTLWTSAGALPQSVTLDFGAVYSNIDMLEYLPTQTRSTGNDISTVSTTGDITGYNVYASADNKTFTKVATGNWPANGYIKRAQFPPTTARYLRLEATATQGGGPGIISEIDAGGVANMPVTGPTGIELGSSPASKGMGFLATTRGRDIRIAFDRSETGRSYQLRTLDGRVLTRGDLVSGLVADIPVPAKNSAVMVLELSSQEKSMGSRMIVLP